jgi:hypothetical protein
MTKPTVCQTCLDWAAEEALAPSEDVDTLCRTLRDAIADPLCEEIETGGASRCACACHPAQELALRHAKAHA